MVTEAQKRAEKNYKAKNKEKVKYWQRKSVAKNFLLKLATDEDLVEFKKLIQEKLTQQNK